jgi:hypothetical protein
MRDLRIAEQDPTPYQLARRMSSDELFLMAGLVRRGQRFVGEYEQFDFIIRKHRARLRLNEGKRRIAG